MQRLLVSLALMLAVPASADDLSARAKNLARAFMAICTGPDMGLAAMQARAASLEFVLRPDLAIASSNWSGGRRRLETLERSGPAGQPPLLTALLEESRRADGSLADWRCEVRMPASAAAPPRREVEAVLKTVLPIIGPRAWTLSASEGPAGRSFVAEQRQNGLIDAYLADAGHHTLGRMPMGAPITIPPPASPR
jgi:hypothetical protein